MAPVRGTAMAMLDAMRPVNMADRVSPGLLSRDRQSRQGKHQGETTGV